MSSVSPKGNGKLPLAMTEVGPSFLLHLSLRQSSVNVAIAQGGDIQTSESPEQQSGARSF